MKRRTAIFVLALSAILALVSCERRARVIPADKLTDIYADIFMADQWAGRDYGTRRHSDTTLLYEPIFNRYGYTTKDYYASVHYYLEKPDKYSRILKRAADKLDRERSALEKIEEKVRNRPHFHPYKKMEFRADSLLAKDTSILWNEPVIVVDSIVVDSIVVDEPDTVMIDTVLIDTVRHHARKKDSLGVLRRDGFDDAPLKRHEPVRKRADGEGEEAWD